MSIDTLTLASQILKALDTGSGIPDVMQNIVDEAQGAPNPEAYVRQIISEVNVYPGTDYDDDRERAIALLQHVLEHDI